MTDFDQAPTSADRNEICILCSGSYMDHNGFACSHHAHKYTYEQVTCFASLPKEDRFFTQSMRDRLVAHLGREAWKGKPSLIELTRIQGESGDNWKQFQHKAPGECPCGTNRSACTYHRYG